MKLLGTQDIQIHEIDPGQRLREPDPHWVELFAATLKGGGYLPPIQVAELDDGSKILISGMHRLAAATGANQSVIRADVFRPNPDQAKAQILEMQADENLRRNELNMLDRAVFLAEWKRVYETLHPESRNGAQGGAGGKRNENDTMSFSKETEKRVGLDKRTIERAVSIAFQISPEIRRQIRGTELADNQNGLLHLADQDERTQSRAVILLNEGKAKNIKAAVAKVTGTEEPELSARDKQYKRLMDAWVDAKDDVRKSFLDKLRNLGELGAG